MSKRLKEARRRTTCWSRSKAIEGHAIEKMARPLVHPTGSTVVRTAPEPVATCMMDSVERATWKEGSITGSATADSGDLF